MNIIAMKISSAAKIIALGIASALLLSCAPDWGYDTKFGNMPSDRPGHGDRVPSPETRKVLLLYSAVNPLSIDHLYYLEVLLYLAVF